jgi:hypothetical protein
MVNQIFRYRVLVQSGVEGGSSANQVSRGWKFSKSGFDGLNVQPIRLWRAGSSANQVSRGWEFNQLGAVGLALSSNQVFSSWVFHQSDTFGLPLSSNQVSRGWEFSQSGNFTIWVSSSQFFFGAGRSGYQIEGPFFIIVENCCAPFLSRIYGLWKRDITLRNYFEAWKRLAVSGAPEGCRWTTSRCFRSFW